VAFPCLPCPPCGDELAGLELAYKFSLVCGWVEAEGFFAELDGVLWEGVFFHLGGFLFELLEFPFQPCHGHCFSISPMVFRSCSSSLLIWVTS